MIYTPRRRCANCEHEKDAASLHLISLDVRGHHVRWCTACLEGYYFKHQTPEMCRYN